MNRFAPTFSDRWLQAVQTVGHRPFLIWEDAEGNVSSWTYEGFDALVARTAAGLVRRGVGPGDCVHLVLRNSPAFVALWLATCRIGAWMLPSDPMSTPAELRIHLARTSPTVGVCATGRQETYLTAAEGTGVEVVAVDEADTTLEVLAGPVADIVDVGRPRPRDRAAVMFTSGTTSSPKGVVLTQANYAFAGDVMAAAAALNRYHRQLVVLPLFHANAQYYSFASAISAGASVALMAAFSASGFLAQAARHRATHASLFAAPMRMILARGAHLRDDLSLIHCWYAQNITSEQYEELSLLLGCRPRQLYGMTETVPAVLTSRDIDPRPDTMGHPTLGCRVEIHDSAGLPAPPDETGQIVVGGRPGYELFDGYLDDPETTAASFSGGWFLTGDRAWMDSAGHFHFAGRSGDVLKVAGENVSVVEVESVLAQHPDILEAAVIGAPDDIRDEVPVAFVVPRPGRAPREDSLASWCEERLAPAKRPRRFHLLTELPRTSVGKIRKFLLTESPDTSRPDHTNPAKPGARP